MKFEPEVKTESLEICLTFELNFRRWYAVRISQLVEIASEFQQFVFVYLIYI